MQYLRSFLERVSHNLVFRRKMPEAYGGRALYVSPEGGLRYWKPTLSHIDTKLFMVVERFIRPGHTVWDIGANLGLFSVAAAHRIGSTGRCLSVEPDVWLVNLLNRTVALNNDLKIDVLPVAVSDKVGFAQFNIAQRSRSTNYLTSVVGTTQTGGVRRTVNVVTTTLDMLLTQFQKPDFLKIDVETAELLVLQGAERLLKEVRPVIYCEVAGENNDQIVDILTKAGYILFNVEDGKIDASTATSENTLAFPAGHPLLPK